MVFCYTAILQYNFTVKYCITCFAPYLQQHTVNYGALWENVVGIEIISDSFNTFRGVASKLIIVAPVSENAVPIELICHSSPLTM